MQKPIKVSESAHQSLQFLSTKLDMPMGTIVSELISALMVNQMSIPFIQSQLGKLDLTEVIEVGMQNQSDKADKRMYSNRRQSAYNNSQKQPSLPPATYIAKEACCQGQAETWSDVLFAIREVHPNFVEPIYSANEPIVSNKPLNYPIARWLTNATKYEFTVNHEGNIERIS